MTAPKRNLPPNPLWSFGGFVIGVILSGGLAMAWSAKEGAGLVWFPASLILIGVGVFVGATIGIYRVAPERLPVFFLRTLFVVLAIVTFAVVVVVRAW